MSWGANEFSGETAYDSVFTTPTGHNGVMFVAGSGDSGTTEYPAASPNVLSVGGTTLNVTPQGGYVSETGWSDSGTGYSPYESEPSWQTTALGTNESGTRMTPDVAWDANPSTGVSVYDSVPYYGQSGWFTIGGTSVGAPSWAGLIAITDQGLAQNGIGSLSNAQASLYQLSSNDFNHPGSGSTGSSSSATYSLVTGLGSPKAPLVIAGILAANSVPNGSATAQVAVSTPAHHVRATSLRFDVTSSSTSATGSSSGASSIAGLSSTGACGQYHVLGHLRIASTGDAGQLDPGATGCTASHGNDFGQPEHCSVAFAGAESAPTTSELVAKPGN